MFRKVMATLLVALSICALAACATGPVNGDPPGADKPASGSQISGDASAGNPGEAPDTAGSDVPPTDEDTLWQGDSAWDFTAELADGTNFTLSDQAGKIVLVNFWATWCGPCVRELPDIVELYDEYANGDDVEIVLVNCGESAETVQAFLGQSGYVLPVAYDAEGTIAGAYGVVAIPRTVVFGRDGTVAADYTGMQDYDTFKSAINDALES